MTTPRRLAKILIATLLLGLTAGCGAGATTRAEGQRPVGSTMGSQAQGHMAPTATCAAPLSLPGTRISVLVGDMGMAMGMGTSGMMGGVGAVGGPMMLRAAPTQARAGQVSFAIDNRGWRAHEMVVLPLAPGQATGQRIPDPKGQVDETGSLGEASASCAADSGEGIESGAAGWVTLTLKAGRYELLCNLRDHYASGMHQELVVS